MLFDLDDFLENVQLIFPIFVFTNYFFTPASDLTFISIDFIQFIQDLVDTAFALL